MHAQVAEVDQVAVVGDGDEALGGVDANRLRIEQGGIAGCGVARVPDGHVALEPRDDVVGEDLRDKAHALDVRQMRPVGGSDAGGFLSAMLQRVEAEVDLQKRVLGQEIPRRGAGSRGHLFGELGFEGG